MLHVHLHVHDRRRGPQRRPRRGGAREAELLRAHLLRTQRGRELIVVHADTARETWLALDQRLRPFVARRVAIPADVDDGMQDVFVRLHRGVGALRDEQRYGPWLFRVARSALSDHHRRARRHPSAPAAAAPELPAPPEAEVDLNELLAAAVRPVVATLPEPYREALTLTELEGLTQREAAERLGISLPGMKSRVQRGRRLLREAFEACCAVALDARGHVVACEPKADWVVGCCAESPEPRAGGAARSCSG